MELLVLSTLKWKMCPVTSISFFEHFVRRFGLKSPLHWEFHRRSERVLLSVIAGTWISNIRLDGEKELVSAWVLPRVLHFFAKNLCCILCTETSKLAIYCFRETSTKKGDFGLAKLFPDDIIHISTRIAGTAI